MAFQLTACCHEYLSDQKLLLISYQTNLYVFSEILDFLMSL